MVFMLRKEDVVYNAAHLYCHVMLVKYRRSDISCNVSSSRATVVHVLQAPSVFNKVTLVELKTSLKMSIVYVESPGHEEL